MKRKTLFGLMVTLGLTLALSSGMATADKSVAGAILGPQAVVGDTFTYQGRLTDDGAGNPIAGPCDFQFSLWTDGLLGSQVGSTQTKTNVTLSNGYFGVTLDFGAAAFSGDARYLQIAVRCPASSGGYTTLDGRVELTAAPYAHSLRPGATIQGSVAPGSIVRTHNTATGILAGNGLEGVSANSIGVYGESTGGSGAIYGVYGKTNSPAGYGVYATNTAAGGGFEEPVALQAELNSANGFAIVGINNSGRGVYGEGSGRYGVGGFSDTSYGVFGKSASGPGVLGEGSYTGTVGVANASSLTAYGVYGKSSSPAGYGVYGLNDNDGNGVGGYGYNGVAGYGSNSGVYGETDGMGAHGVYGRNTHTSSGYGVYGRGFRGVQGYTTSVGGVGGFFMDMNTTASGTSVGVWAGSYCSDIFQGHELDANGNSSDRRFRVTYNGEVYADGNFHAGGADLAEMLPAADGLAAGDVLIVGPDGKLARSSAAFATAVVGVYSTQPGFVGGSSDNIDSTGKVPLAIVGIVPVKASAENGPIQPGDLLVASSTPGHAMKAGPNPPIGSVIGKAFGALESGKGVIQMLVTLQ